MTFFLRREYGYKEDEILSNIEKYGLSWVYQAYRVAKEDQYIRRMWEINTTTLAQTPQSKKGGKQQASFIKKLVKAAEAEVPWITDKKQQSLRNRVKQPVEPRVKIEGADDIPEEVLNFFKGTSVTVQVEEES